LFFVIIYNAQCKGKIIKLKNHTLGTVIRSYPEFVHFNGYRINSRANLANIHIYGIESNCFEIQGLQRAVDDSYSHYIHAYDIVHAYFTITPTHHCEVKPCVQTAK
jgi:hypothetical protein